MVHVSEGQLQTAGGLSCGNEDDDAASQVEEVVERLLGGWKEVGTRELSALLGRRIHHLQNPPDCSKAKKLVCKTCGFGCQVHHLAMCFAVAYGTQRTLVLHTDGWRYASEGWVLCSYPSVRPAGIHLRASVCVCVCVCVCELIVHCVFVCVCKLYVLLVWLYTCT